MRARILILALCGLTACQDGTAPDSQVQGLGTDADGDGHTSDVDCDDNDITVFPGATERCDSIDNDCDGLVDEDSTTTWYRDADGDLAGNASQAFWFPSCNPGVGWVANTDDCDDTDDTIYANAEELCDGIDNDCDASIDEGAMTDWAPDSDGDGYGGSGTTVEACTAPSGYGEANTDCDDADSSSYPGATEYCDGLDNDCDGSIDEFGALGAQAWYADDDGDGYGGAFMLWGCSPGSAAVGTGGDCDDTDSAINPDGTEVCDGADNDCDGGADNVDADGDTFAPLACGGTDCDDEDSGIHPEAIETWYDGIDADCALDDDYDADADGFKSDAYGGDDCDDFSSARNPGATDIWYDGVDADCGGDDDFDADADGYQSDAHGGTDCDDTQASTYPGAADVWYDGVDSDCGGGSDYDADGDGEPVLGYGGDCDDEDPTVLPGATEIWYDGVDQDCSGTDDYDADGDGYSSDAHSGDDCDDGDSAISPGALEICNDGIDQDCDGAPTGCGPWEDISVSYADAIIRGNAADDRLSQGDPGFAAAGDINGDGVGDFTIGAIKSDSGGTDAGTAYVFFGPVTGQFSANTADLRVNGESTSDFFGRGVQGAKDVDNDGYDDLLFAAINDDDGGTNAGAVYLFNGPRSGSTNATAADAKIWGEDAGDILGELGFAGDINNDGHADLFFAAQFHDGKKGAAYLFYGPVSTDSDASAADAIFVGENAGDEAGSSLGGGGDIDGDGNADLLIAARGEDTFAASAGALYVIYGGSMSGSTDLSSADAKLTGEAAGHQIGWGVSIASAGDTNNDGYDDVVVGNRYDSTLDHRHGAVYIIEGPIATGTASLSTADAKVLGEAAADLVGDSVHGPGDVDNDGYDDIIVGSGYNDAGAKDGGAVYVLQGPFSGTSSLTGETSRLTASGANDRLRGRGVGDVNNDGIPDVMVGAQFNDDAGTNAGAAYLFYGAGL